VQNNIGVPVQWRGFRGRVGKNPKEGSINQSKHISIAPYVASESEVEPGAGLEDGSPLKLKQKCEISVQFFNVFLYKIAI